MRGTWWKIAKLELTLAARDRESLIWSLVAPIAMAWLFGTMFGSDGPPKPTRVDLDAGDNPARIRNIASTYFTRRGFELANDGIRVELPDSITARMADGRAIEARVIQGDAPAIRAQAVAATAREMLYYTAFHPGPMDEPAQESRRLDINATPLGAAPKLLTGNERMLPAMLVMYIMFQVMTFFLSLWVDDLRSGKIKRIVMSPATPRDVLFGEVAARLIWAALQVVVILGVGGMLLHVRLDVNWIHLSIVLLAFMLAAASIGMLAASFFRSSEKAGAIGVMISLVLAALGGCWWPLEIVPGAMRAVALLLPTGQAMTAIGSMQALGSDAPAPVANIASLLAMSCVALPLAARRMGAQLVQS